MNTDQSLHGFGELLTKEVFELTKPEKVAFKLNSLFNVFYINKDVLLIVDSYYENNITSNKRFNDMEKKAIKKSIQTNWFTYWTNKTIEHDDLIVIKKHFDSYTIFQQEKLNALIEKHCGKDCLLIAKQKSQLTIALAHYRKGKPDSLEQFVNQATEIKADQLGRIACVMEDTKLIHNTLPIYVEAFKKCQNANCVLEINLSTLLKQPPAHFSDFTQLTYSMFSHLEESTQHRNFLYHHLNIRFGTKLNFIGSMASLVCNTAVLSIEEMPTALKNIEFSLNKTSLILEDYVIANFNLTNKGMDLLFQLIPTTIEKYTEIQRNTGFMEFSKFMDLVENFKTMYSYTKLNEKINETPNTHKKMKI